MKKITAKTFLLLALAFAGAPRATAQISHGGEPLLASQPEMSAITLPEVDSQRLLAEDLDAVKGAGPMRIGVVLPTWVSNQKQGTVRVLEDGTRVWRVLLQSDGAVALGLHFCQYEMPEGARLFLYSPDGEVVAGAFTSEDRMDDGRFYTCALPGEALVVEYSEPASVAGQGLLTIDQVTHHYKPMPMLDPDQFKGQHGSSDGNCHIDVICPEGDNYRDQIRSVVCIEITAGGYSYLCSGALVNNTAQDKAPYILSAYHCQDLNTTVTQWKFYFNYQKSTCNGASGATGNSIAGANIVAKYNTDSGSDMLLLRLKNPVPDNFNAYYAGWSRSSINPTVGAGIHHPGGDWKKISIPQSVSSYNTNYHQVNWIPGTGNKGVTEGGSSGSPLFNGAGQVVGQLMGGQSYCGAPSSSMTDIYGKFSKSWTGGGTSVTRLKDWLDPTNSGVTSLDGIDWNEHPAAISEAAATPVRVYPNPATDMVYLDLETLGEATYKVFSLDGRCALEGSTVLSTTAQAISLKGLASGAYRLVVFTSEGAYSASIIKR